MLPAGIGLFVFLLAYLSPVSNAGSDPHFSLIVSQSILDRGTIRLDPYARTNPDLFEAFSWQIGALPNGHSYYNYPVGPSIFSIPFVWLARLAGKDMLNIGDNHSLQNLISAILSVLVFTTTYLITRCYLPQTASLVITTISVLGSSLISTLATALWNMNYVALFVLLGLLLIARYDSGRSRSINGFFLGTLLFASYLCRPSTAIFILATFVYLAITDRRVLLKTAVTAFIPFLLFTIVSKIEYGQWFPIYYSASFWFSTSDIWKPVYGILLSPSRGLLVFSPFLLTTLGGIGFAERLKRKFLFWLCALWVVLQVLFVSTTRQWWGGYSYGPRLMTDALPALIMMTVLLWSDVGPKLSHQAKVVATTSYVSLGIVAILLNSYQGLFNIKTTLWNAFPSIDAYPEYVFDWKHPQFLVTTNSFHQRRLEHKLRQMESGTLRLEDYQLGDALTLADDNGRAIFSGWWWETGWTEIKRPIVVFIPEDVDRNEEYIIEITSSSHGIQDVQVSFNGVEIGNMMFPGSQTSKSLNFRGGLLKAAEPNRLELYLPDASWPGLSDLRQLGLKFAPHRLGLQGVEIRIIASQ